MLAARRTGRPVRWLGTRAETISGDHHGRGADLIGELALDRRGRFLALRVQTTVYPYDEVDRALTDLAEDRVAGSVVIGAYPRST